MAGAAGDLMLNTQNGQLLPSAIALGAGSLSRFWRSQDSLSAIKACNWRSGTFGGAVNVIRPSSEETRRLSRLERADRFT